MALVAIHTQKNKQKKFISFFYDVGICQEVTHGVIISILFRPKKTTILFIVLTITLSYLLTTNILKYLKNVFIYYIHKYFLKVLKLYLYL